MKTATLVIGILCIALLPFSIVAHVVGLHALDLPPDILKWSTGAGVLLVALAIGFDRIKVSKDGIELEDRP